MSYTTENAANLRAAIASGTLTVKYDGKEVTYRSLAELQEALRKVEVSLMGPGGRATHVNPTYSSGY